MTPPVIQRPPVPPQMPSGGRPIFSVSNLTITPPQVKEHEPVTISAIVSNRGTVAGTYSLVLRINGVVDNITELNLHQGTSQVATFTVVKDIAGDYYMDVDGIAGRFTVIPLIPATFSITDMVITPERIKQGENITISAVATNTGEIAGTYSVVLRIKGIAEGIEEVDLGPGRSQRVTFSFTKDTPGFYQVDMEGLSGRFVVEMEWNE